MTLLLMLMFVNMVINCIINSDFKFEIGLISYAQSAFTTFCNVCLYDHKPEGRCGYKMCNITLARVPVLSDKQFSSIDFKSEKETVEKC